MNVAEKPTLEELREELVDDRALKDVDQDRLRHKDVVDELEQLACAIEVPASVALYGPWGSGKSSLSNLLGERLGTRGIPFARFDAFKYSEAPMRRLFLSQMARELGVTGDPNDPNDKKKEKQRFESGLYTEQSETTVDLPGADITKMLGAFLAVVGLGVLMIAALMALVAIFLDGPWSHAFSQLLLAALPAGAIAAAVIAAVAAFANKTLPVERKRSEPSGEEEFERLFRELVDKVSAERIVIFIDELDRCSSEEVVGTLEAIRTFLDVKPCVVIVAADQQVLERALRRRARQETPFDPRNPYYSSGSGYLDKIFNFQMSLPPLRSRRLSEFALDLVKERGGLWKKVDLDMVLLALIPTHVRSPRRVKALLNAFVANYRLAERRSAPPRLLPEDVRPLAAQIARLTCLQIEFPLFAADLTTEPRLPEFVLAVYLDPEAELPPYVPASVKELARSYARRELEVDEALPRHIKGEDVDSDNVAGPEGTDESPDDSTDQDSDQETDAEVDIEDEQKSHSPSVSGERNRLGVKSAQGQHLLEYLQRSEQVGEIRSDLIYLEGRGTTFGIDPTRADRLENAAVNGDRRAVAEAFGDADDSDARAMLRLLARIAHEAPLGPEAENAVRTMLTGAATKEEAAAALADELLRAFKTHRHHFTLTPEDFSGALVLALAGTESDAEKMLVEILGSRESETDEELGLALIRAGRRALDSDRDRAAMVFAKWLDIAPQATTTALLTLGDAEQREFLELGMDPVGSRLAKRKEELTTTDEEGNQVRDEAAEESLSKRNHGFAEGIGLALKAGHTQIAEALGASLLAANSREARDLFEESLSDLSPVQGEALRAALLNAARHRTLKRWPQWLAAIDPSDLPEESQADAQSMLTTAWNRATGDEPPSSKELGAALDALQPTYKAMGVEPASLDQSAIESAAGSLAGTSTTPLGALRDVSKQFISRGLLSTRGAATAFLSDMQSALADPGIGDPPGAGSLAVEMAIDYGDDTSPEVLQATIEAANNSQWLGQPARPNLLLTLAASLSEQEVEIESPVSIERLRELAEDGQSGTPAIAAWLRAFAISSQEVLSVLTPYATTKPPSTVSRGLAAFCKREGSGEALWIAEHYFSEHGLATPPSEDFLSMLRDCKPNEEKVADWLIGLYAAAGTNDDRKGVMAAWRGFDPRGQSVRKRLITEIYLPFGNEYKGAFKVALKNIALVKDPPYGIKGDIKKALRSQAKDHDLRRTAEYAIAEVGLDRAKVGFRDRMRREESLED